MTTNGYLTIGKAVEKLKHSYPELTISKLRYLEDEGLIDPMRSPSGYRMYSPRDIKLIEDVLYLQKTHFMPLSVIKEKLLSQKNVPDTALTHDPVVAGVSLDVTARENRRLFAIDRMPEVAQVSVSFVRELADVGLIQFKKSPQGRDLVESVDIPLIQTCDKLTHFGIGPKNLRQYVTSANRERSMFEHALVVFATKAGGVAIEATDEKRRAFDEAFNEILLYTNLIRVSLIRKHIEETFKDYQGSQE